jgi:diaphanous 1
VPTPGLRCHAADLLAALCVLSPKEGHGLVLAALSDTRFKSGQLRFEALIKSFDASHGSPNPGQGVTQTCPTDGIWEWRVSALGLLNALVNTPGALELRCQLRAELYRRGLNYALSVS